MNEHDKQQLINLASKTFCVECGKREHEYALLDNNQTINSKQVTIPNVPTFKCNNCGALSYPSFGMKYIEEYISKISLE
ncbi:hypothetical protein [Paenibacillus sp. MSJ-34]|uniref:hypothetical protein n=1 Tax=Paenibacillus sp. MSJ-34 TaxID=2841529 RepID=UPI001C127D6B|nr:hypothetical protein [Paenibacillus sp. MSJ-34]MBU5445633.1 hypothetical protein [Paenibacillus sp. MSJ-34]